MRIRMVKRAAGEIDGVLLSRFDPGDSYDVSVSIGTYLVVRGFARAADVAAPPAASVKRKRVKGEPTLRGRAAAHRRLRADTFLLAVSPTPPLNLAGPERMEATARFVAQTPRKRAAPPWPFTT